MPWYTSNVMEQRIRFIAVARTTGCNLTSLCKEFGISRKTGYKWLNRSEEKELVTAAEDKSRRPWNTPTRTSSDIEEKLVELRKQYPYWGARKLGLIIKEKYPEIALPHERTINRIFSRYGLVETGKNQDSATKRFEYEQSNDLWQMDYKGEFSYGDSKQYCYPLTVLDDHSRYNIVLKAQDRISTDGVMQSLKEAFQKNGMPKMMLMDRGSVWYTSHSKLKWTRLTVWLMQLGIDVIHARARHPQTNGKIERYHRTLKYDLIKRRTYQTFAEIENSFKDFCHEYNYIRPHEALNYKRPGEVYRTSDRIFTEKLPPIEYPDHLKVKKLSSAGTLFFRGKYLFISEALVDQYVGIEEINDVASIYFFNTLIKTIDLREGR